MTLPIIPSDWTVREALAVYEFIDAIREEIWRHYSAQLQEHHRTERSTDPADWTSLEDSADFDEKESF